jgi:glucosyl-dolichyl phosphate glucuronosyltransferase
VVGSSCPYPSLTSSSSPGQRESALKVTPSNPYPFIRPPLASSLPGVVLDVSVVVCAYRPDRLDDIEEAVQSLSGQTIGPKEIIVVTDQVDGLQLTLTQRLPAGVQVIENQWGHGLSHARNTGAYAASSQLVAFLDDDAIATPKWLESLLEAFTDASVVAGSGRAVPLWKGSGIRPWWFPEELDWVVGCAYEGLGSRRRYIRNVAGSNMCLRKRVLEEVGGFEARVGGPIGGDDTEICLKISAANEGYRIVYDPRAVVYHKVPIARQTLQYLLYFSSIQGTGKGIIKRIHPTHPQVLASEREHLRHLAFSFFPGRLAALAKGRWHAIVHIFIVFLSVCATLYGYYSARIVDQVAVLQGRPERLGPRAPKRG